MQQQQLLQIPPSDAAKNLEKKLSDEIHNLTRKRTRDGRPVGAAHFSSVIPVDQRDTSCFFDGTLEQLRRNGMSMIFKLVVEALLQPEVKAPTNVLELMSVGDLSDWLHEEQSWHWKRELERKREQRATLQQSRHTQRLETLKAQTKHGFVPSRVREIVEREEAADAPARKERLNDNVGLDKLDPCFKAVNDLLRQEFVWPLPDEDPPVIPLHPCIKAFGNCQIGDECLFARYPVDACLACLKFTCRMHTPMKRYNTWDESVSVFRNKRDEIQKAREDRILQTRQGDLPPTETPPEISERLHDFQFQTVYKVKVQQALTALSSMDASPILLEEINLGDQRSYLITNINKPMLFSLYNMLLRECGDTDLFCVPSEAPRVKRPNKVTEVVSNLNKIAYLSRPEITQVEKEVEEILAHQSIEDKQFTGDYWKVWKAFNYRPAVSVARIRKFHHEGLTPFEEFCARGTVDDCKRDNVLKKECDKIHFRRLIFPHTDIEAGDCSYLDTCRRMSKCKFVHYTLLPSVDMNHKQQAAKRALIESGQRPENTRRTDITTAVWTQGDVGYGLPNKHWQDDWDGGPNRAKPLPCGMKINSWTAAQWIKCDVRTLDMSILGKFDVIMADPPWDIHMELPYGTMADHEMKALNIGNLCDHGLIFLWVTGRAMEVGRECMHLWGYKVVEEIVWVKINQLQRIIRTGRTGHWLNHSKEHCIVGIKGNPKLNCGLDCDVIACEVRETSRKPDEIYGVIERICPDGRKLEVFARTHNIHTGWLSLGNQLPGVNIHEPQLMAAYNKFVKRENEKRQKNKELEEATKQRDGTTPMMPKPPMKK